MKTLLATVCLLLACISHASPPTHADRMFDLLGDEPIAFVQQDADRCNETLGAFRRGDQEQASNDLMMGLMLAARESGMQIEIIDEETCRQK